MSAEQSRPLTPEEEADLAAARELIAGGIPVFAARPALDADGNWDPAGGTDGCGYWLPPAWQKTVPTEKWLDPTAPGYENKAWRPGWALGAVMGHGLDLLDVDPRNGGDATRTGLVLAGVWPRVYGAADTPSGGTHEFVASLDVGSRDAVRPGLDVKGGKADGESRGFAFIAPTLKVSKTTGEIGAYRWTMPPDLDALTDGDDDSGEAIAELVRQARQGTKATPGGTGGTGDPFDEPGRKHAGPIADGERHAKLISYAGWLRSIGLPLAEARTLMERRWQDVAQPQPGSSGRNSPTPLPWPDARQPLPLSEAYDKLDDIYRRYSAGDPRAEHAANADAAGEAPDGAESAAEASWAPVDLTRFLDGTHVPVEPTLLRRSDGVALLYPGLVHSFHGESESGKSLLLQIEAARLVAAGEDVLFIDFESDAESVSQRLVTFGADPGDILKHFHYVRPQTAPDSNADERAAFAVLLMRRYALAVIDGVTDSLTIFNFKTKENDDITAWMRSFPRRIADRTGAAVALVDHVTKDGDTRGRFAIGGQAKMNGLTGAAYTVDIATPLGKGLRGEIVLRVAKDRPGQVRVHCGLAKLSDRTQEAARIVVDSSGQSPVVSVNPPRSGGGAESGWQRPTVLMERLSRAAELTPGLGKNDLSKQVVGTNRQAILRAIDLLVAEGFLLVKAGPGNRQLHHSSKPYRRTLDPLDDEYQGAGTTDPFDMGGSGSSPYTGDLEPPLNPVPGTTAEPPGTTPQDPAWTSLEEGPCATCSKPTRKYGAQGHKLCQDCRRRTDEAAGA